MEIGVSYGTAVKLGLIRASAIYPPNTAYLLLGRKCVNNCAYCSLARRENTLSRVLWPPFPLGMVREALEKVKFTRICVQTADYPGMEEDLLRLGGELSKFPNLTASVSPRPRAFLSELRDSGFTGVGIALDAASERIFEAVRGRGVGNPFTWEGTWRALAEARGIFEDAATHLIVGLGESDVELYDTIRRALDMGLHIGLFALTPVVPGMEAPDLGRYRTVQLLLHALKHDYLEDVEFSDSGRILELRLRRSAWKFLRDGSFAVTSGCPGCDRPFYNERPSGPIYNFPRAPGRPLLSEVTLYARVCVGSGDYWSTAP